MPLSIRDGNSSLTTLSTIVVSSAHIPAHTVVSLGSQAITDIAGAVSGVELGPNTISALENISVVISAGTSITIGNVVSVTGGLTNAELRASSVTIGGSVSVSNLPATQTVTFGQAVVSASNIGNLNDSVGTDGGTPASTKFIKIGGHQDGQNQVEHIVHVSAGGAMKVDASDSSVTFGAIRGTVTVGNSVTISSLPAISGTVTVGNTVTISGTVTANPTGTQTIAGTVTANGGDFVFEQNEDTGSSDKGVMIGWREDSTVQFRNTSNAQPLPVQVVPSEFTGTQPISGTVTANLDQLNLRDALDYFAINYTEPLPVSIQNEIFGTVTIGSLPAISGTVTASQFFTVVTSATINFATTVTSTEAFDTTDDYDFVVIQTDLNNSGQLGTVYIDRYTTPTASGGSSNFALWDDKNKELFNAGGGNDLCTTKNQKSIYYSTGFASRFYYRFRTADNAGGISGSAKLYAIKSDYPTERTNNDAFGVGKIPVAGDFYLTNSSVTANIGNSVTIGSLPSISGTVTANINGTVPVSISSVTIGNSVTIASFATSVTARLINPAGTAVTYAEVGTAGNPSIDVLSVQGVSGGTNLPIAGSVTISGVPNGALTTRFGSVTTANTAQISSAVTNTARRYLLIQNVTTSSNVITVGVGFTPTTTQGIQLTAGAGITFESSYIPTGAVYILSSVTASTFTILEA